MSEEWGPVSASMPAVSRTRLSLAVGAVTILAILSCRPERPPAPPPPPPEQAVAGSETRADETGDDAQAAVTAVRDYYGAISSRDYRKAYASWGPTGPPGQTFESFAAGFANTESVDVTTGEPSRVEPAAGSRYVTVPVTIVARTKSGATERFEGTYTLRRSVVDGASEAQRRWHLYRASLRRV